VTVVRIVTLPNPSLIYTIARHTFSICDLPTPAGGIIGLNFLSSRRAKLDLGKMFLTVALDPSDFVSPRPHESLCGECSGREGHGLITHVSISQNITRDGSATTENKNSDSRNKKGHFGGKASQTSSK
jgi:hypothetical protein